MMAPGDANGCGSCGLSGEMEAASTWREPQLPAYIARGSAWHAGSCSLRFWKGTLRARGRRMEEVRAKDSEGGGLLKENGDRRGREDCGAGLGGCRLS